jgi:O-antigen ligase
VNYRKNYLNTTTRTLNKGQVATKFRQVPEAGLLKLSYILGIAIGIGAVGCEWLWNQQVPGVITFALYAMAFVGVIFVVIKSRALQQTSKINMKWFLLSGWFILTLLVERLSATMGSDHMPFDRQYQLILFCYFLGIICGFVGLRIGGFSQVANSFLERAAFVLAVISVYIYFFGTPTRGSLVVFPSQYVSFPMRLLCLFAFCWYLDKWFRGERVLTWQLVGLAASAMPTLVLFHKPIVVSALFSTIALILINIYKGMVTRIFFRVIILIFFSAALFAIADVATGGAVSENIIQQVYSAFLHATPDATEALENRDLLESSAGGRFELWQDAWQNFLEHPIFGTGLGQQVEESAFTGTAIPIHNGYLDILLSVGLFGAVAVVIGIICFALTAMSKLKTQDAIWVTPTLAYIVGIGTYNLGGTSNLFIFQSAFLLLCMGMIAAPMRNDVRSK